MKPYTMNEAETLLVEALESGRYSQTRRQLKVEDSFCCLGVACQILLVQKGEAEWRARGKLKTLEGYSTADLPSTVRKMLDRSSREGQLTAEGQRIVESETKKNGMTHLTALNDIGYDFPYIASVIRRGFIQKADKEEFA